jgi:endo-1,4-beta-xylanase
MTEQNINKAILKLHEVYKDYFTIGAAVNRHTVKQQQELLLSHFNSITAENDMKFESLQPIENQFNFVTADKLVEFAGSNGMQVRGHTLVWHNQTPEWVFTDENGEPASKELLLARMKNHITTVMGRYKGKIASWDVVNEVIEDHGDQLLRSSKWLDIVGPEFIEIAFEYAHEADPNAKLFYNDYNESFPEKREKIYTLVKTLVEKGVPIHGVGLQAHWNLHTPSLDHIKEAIERYASLGLNLHLTELDISVFDFEDKRTDLLQPTEEMLDLQNKRYEQIFALLRDYKEVISNVTFWGAADDYTWLSDFPVRGRKNWPFVFDENHNPKPSFWGITDFKKK